MNLLEEARSLQSSFPPGTSLTAMAKAVRRSVPWVKYRMDILKMPAKLQESIASGLLKMNDIRVLVTLPVEKRLSAAETMLRHGRGSFRQPKGARFRKKRRSQINRMIERLFDAGIDGLPTMLLAWTHGGVSDEAIEKEILAFSHNHLSAFAVEVADDNPHRQPSDSVRDQPRSESGCHEVGDDPDCPDDPGDLSPARD